MFIVASLAFSPSTVFLADLFLVFPALFLEVNIVYFICLLNTIHQVLTLFVSQNNFQKLKSSHECLPVINITFVSVCLRLQVNPQNKSHFHGISPERGFADFIFAQVVLHLVVMNFIG